MRPAVGQACGNGRGWPRTSRRSSPSTPTVRGIGLSCSGSPTSASPACGPTYSGRSAKEDAIECHFGEPVANGDRAAVEWWSSWSEGGHDLTMAGVTILRFDADDLVVDHRDYWNQLDRREPPFDGW